MKIAKFIDMVDSGLDVEIHYKGRTYWAAWGNGNEKMFYEAHKKDAIVFHKAEEILDKEYQDFIIRDMIEDLDEDKDVYC
ncbi:hypothetical protein IJH02_03865 [Candidatus Saccharibacteria bacterium]|nr:hypothetical protein [Candidatus Saccharibacteria bacterium]